MADEKHDHSHQKHLWPGVPLAIGAAILFGLSTPVSKLLLAAIQPQLLAGLLYLGAGLGLAAIHFGRSVLGIPAPEAPLRGRDLPWLGAIVLFGGIAGPLLLMLGLNRIGGAEGSLLLNLEGLATMAIAWIAFRENVDRRLLLGALAILAGAVTLSWRGQGLTIDGGSLLIAGACLAWGIDNNLTRKLSAADPVAIAMAKGLGAGAVNAGIAGAQGAGLPASVNLLAAGVVGFFSIGVSLVLFILGLRHLGAARTGAYFSTAPFIGAAVAIPLLGEAPSWQLATSGGLMAFGLWLHLSELHEHEHTHEALEHEHAHVHDEHHRHPHDGPVTEPHAHPHRHQPMRHKHVHYPDLHHRHPHG